MPENKQIEAVLEPSTPPGSTISWMSVNGPVSGVTEAFRDGNYLVRLGDGRHVIVNEISIIPVNNKK